MTPKPPPDALLNEFHGVMNDAAGAHAFAVWGLAMATDWTEDPANLPPNLHAGSTFYFGHGEPTQGGFHYQRWLWSELPEHLGGQGTVMRHLGQQWLVLVVSHWEDHFRQRFAEYDGLSKKSEFKDPVFGDLNKMRNDVVHHRGIATDRNTGRCEELRWFEPGETIHIMPIHVADFMDYLGLKESMSDVQGGFDSHEFG